MATKYKKQKNGYFQTRVWDGTYQNGIKHHITLRSKKSSKDLEAKVANFKVDVEERKNVRKTDITFLQYANTWFAVYKASKSNNTKRMYRHIIDKHLHILDGIRLQDIDRIHLQQAINGANGKSRTQEQIRMTFRQIIQSAVADHLCPANVDEDKFRNTESIKYQQSEQRHLK